MVQPQIVARRHRWQFGTMGLDSSQTPDTSSVLTVASLEECLNPDMKIAVHRHGHLGRAGDRAGRRTGLVPGVAFQAGERGRDARAGRVE